MFKFGKRILSLFLIFAFCYSFAQAQEISLSDGFEANEASLGKSVKWAFGSLAGRESDLKKVQLNVYELKDQDLDLGGGLEGLIEGNKSNFAPALVIKAGDKTFALPIDAHLREQLSAATDETLSPNVFIDVEGQRATDFYIASENDMVPGLQKRENAIIIDPEKINGRYVPWPKTSALDGYYEK